MAEKEYIERGALIEKLRIMPIPKLAGSGATWLDNCAAGVNDAIRVAASFPAADVAEVRHGEWVAKDRVSISKRGRFIEYSTYKCSICGKWNGRHKQNFCPNCGAKMDGERKEQK